MEIRFTAEQEAWRDEVRAFLDKELPPEKEFNQEFEEDPDLWDFAREFTRKVGEQGWIGLTWPKEYGGLERTPIEEDDHDGGVHLPRGADDQHDRLGPRRGQPPRRRHP